ncbi:MAG: Helix-turn-helix protein [Mucilaginibacter sp.]|nr:Helix-turn-helix protein [Mucilaginibacter sp.]
MVCIRCKMVVKHELENLGLFCLHVEIGRVEVEGTVSAVDIMKFKIALLGSGLELIYDKRSILVEKIKNIISEMVNYSDDPLKTNFSYYLSDKLSLDYTYLANVFSEHQGITIERFIIMNRIQKVKELICYNELNLTEISWKLHYSSVAHLSTQFKKITGITPSFYKHLECSNPVSI